MVRLRLWSQMGAGSFTATRRFNSMTCLVFARNALTPELRGKIMQKPYLVSKNVSVTLHSPKQAPGQKSSRCIKRGGQTTTWSITTGIGRARTGGTAPSEVLRGVLGRTFPEEVLSRALYATQFTRQIDRHGFVKFKHWRLYGELGLAGEDVSVWVYEGNLKVEYQATALALYELSIEKDTGKIAKVTSARRLETHFRSAQLDLWQISDTEWLLALRRPEPAARKKAGKIVSLVEQLVLPEFGATG